MHYIVNITMVKKGRVKRRKRAVRVRRARARKAGHTGIDENFEHFIEELGVHHKHIAEKHHATRDWWYGTFGVVGPLLGASIGMICVAIVAFILSMVYAVTGTPFISLLSAFLNINLPVFLLVFLVLNYLKHIYLSHERLYYIVKPIKVAFGIAVAFWLLAWVMQFAGMQAGSIQLMSASLAIMGSLTNIFFGFLVLGYIVALVKRERDLYGKRAF